MDLIWAAFLCFIGALGLAAAFLRHRSHQRGRIPPGPPGWPVFGNMFDLGTMPHKTLAGLKQTYGGVVSLRIGSIDTVVLLTAAAATELFKNHDAAFAERNITDVMTACRFHEASVSLSPYGPYWRVMKRVMMTEMLVQRRVVATEPIRRRCVADLAAWVSEAAYGGRAVHVAKFVFLASFNMLGNLMLSRDLVDPASAVGSKFFKAMVEFMEWSGHPNVADVFPFLRRLDPQGLRRKVEAGMGETLDIVAQFVAERLNSDRRPHAADKDYLDVLLDCNTADGTTTISQHDLNIVILEIFLAGSETTSSSIEWVMVELLKHPEAMEKTKAELRRVVSPGESFQEQHIESLPYLQALVKETLRLHPPVPFLVPRRAIQETNFMGYQIPRDTQLFVNTWAIGRDPECWDDPLSFKPERFLGSNVDYKGQHYELIPFGAGRRICAGIPLAHRMLHLILGTLLHEFRWNVDEFGKNGIWDERERMGITVRKLVPLEAIPWKDRG